MTKGQNYLRATKRLVQPLLDEVGLVLVDVRSTKHIQCRLQLPDSDITRQCTFPRTPSCPRSYKNMRAVLRRLKKEMNDEHTRRLDSRPAQRSSCS